ncbi:MAG: hypothetical protein CGW95_02490 [Phenylobacterium zucineum]|nr:MAG: hypothetical protein CGW95_02490 [Phenylobacterium zucineum]
MRKFALLATSALVAAVTAGAAHAQSSGTTIEELVVTAEKREQSLQDIPIAISAFTSKQRDLVGISTIQDLTNFTPGFVYQSANDRASMRGIGRLTNVHSVDGAVSIYVDGVFTTSTILAGGPPIQTDRVEILRGPQGTLYGRNAIGGTVNVISAKPTDHPYAEVRAVVENFGYTDFQVAASGPVTDGLSLRLDAYKRDQRKGYYTNVNPNMPEEGQVRNEFQYQLQAKAKLGENADLWMKYTSLSWDNSGGPGARASYRTVAYDPSINDAIYSNLIPGAAYGYTNNIVPGSLVQFNGGTTTTNPALKDPHLFNTNTPIKDKLTDVQIFATNFTYHLSNIDVKYVGGFTNYKYDLYGDADFTNVKSYQIPLAAGSICGNVHNIYLAGASTVDCGPRTVNADAGYHYYEYPKWYSHEINISSTDDGPVQWILGAYYYNEQYTGTGSTADFFIKGASPLNTPILGKAANPNGYFSTGHYGLTTESKAVFGQVDWKATEQLKVTLGLRYTKDHKWGSEYRRVVASSDAFYSLLYPGLGLGSFGPGTSANWGSLLGNVNAVPAVGQALANVGAISQATANALKALTGLGNGAYDLTVAGAPTTTVPVKGVTSPLVGNTQYVIDPVTGEAVRKLGDTSDAVTGTLGLQWDPTEDTMAYARYSRGYKAFGFNAGALLPVPEALPESVNSYEVGVKTNFGRTLQINAALFYLDYSNLQAPVSVYPPGSAVRVNQFINIAKSRSNGLEMDVIWQPIQPLRLTLDYAYNPTRIEKSVMLVDTDDNLKKTTAISIVGNSLPQAPKNKVAVNASYAFRMDAGTLTLGASYLYRDKAYAGVFSRDYFASKSWDQIDLRAHWAPEGNKYTVIAYVKNLADSAGYDAAVTPVLTSVGTSSARNLELTPPRTFGVELQYRFF